MFRDFSSWSPLILPTPHNKQLERTVTPHRVRAASTAFHCALATRLIWQRAVAQLQRYAPF